MAKNKIAPKATMARPQPKRHTRIVSLVSEEENRIIDEYLKKYRITNKSMSDIVRPLQNLQRFMLNIK